MKSEERVRLRIKLWKEANIKDDVLKKVAEEIVKELEWVLEE